MSAADKTKLDGYPSTPDFDASGAAATAQSNAEANAASLYLPLAGGTVSGNIAMGGNNISGAGTITATTLVGVLTGHASSDLQASNNLSDVTNASTARTNLGLGTAAVANTGTSNGNVPVISGGTIPSSIIPTLNQNTTGTASNVTGTVAIANGGTGATTASGALSNLGALPLSGGTMSGALNLNTNAINLDSDSYIQADGSGDITIDGRGEFIFGSDIHDINFSQLAAKNFVVASSTSAPSGVGGQLYYNSAAHLLFANNGTSWIQLSSCLPLAGGTMSGAINMVGNAINFDGYSSIQTSNGSGNLEFTARGEYVFAGQSDNGINFNGNPAVNFVLDVESSAPTALLAGQLYYNTSSHLGFLYNGTSWVQFSSCLPLSGGTISGAINTSAGSTLTLQNNGSTTDTDGVDLSTGTFSNSSGTAVAVAIKPTYNQTSTGAATDLLVNRTETAVGSGAQRLIDLQVGGSSKVYVDDKGNTVCNGTGSALATTATNGFLYIPAMGGPPSEIPANIPTGTVPIFYDTVDNLLWGYVVGIGWVNFTPAS
jgi:hypothetical protein